MRRDEEAAAGGGGSSGGEAARGDRGHCHEPEEGGAGGGGEREAQGQGGPGAHVPCTRARGAAHRVQRVGARVRASRMWGGMRSTACGMVRGPGVA
eukprot:3652234-Rhodomonas_salina.2